MEKEVIINLNGKKITAPTKPSESTAVFKVKNGRTLIINGDGVVDGGAAHVVGILLHSPIERHDVEVRINFEQLFENFILCKAVNAVYGGFMSFELDHTQNEIEVFIHMKYFCQIFHIGGYIF